MPAFAGIILPSKGWFRSVINAVAKILHMSEPFGGFFLDLISTDEDCGTDGRNSYWEIDGNDFDEAEQYSCHRLR